jgi:Beta-lactamase class C and other penicillin bindi ng proteins
MVVRNSPRVLGRPHHWWAGQVQHAGRSLAWIAGFGNGGQSLVVVPELDRAVVFTSGAHNSEQIGPIEGALLRRIVAAVGLLRPAAFRCPGF